MDEVFSSTYMTPSYVARIAIAALLLNLGLFPVLYVVAPIATGVIVGLLLKKAVNALATGFFPAFASYLVILALIATVPGIHFQIADQFVAALLWGAAGGVGGFFGVFIARIVPQNRLN